jgi:hypothetical protein
MLLRLLAIVALFLITSSNALSLDTLSRHQQIAARHPAVKRSVSARCQKRNSSSTAAASSSPLARVAPHTTHSTSSAHPAVSSSHSAPSSSHPAPSPSPPPPASSPSSGSGKLGIAWALGNSPFLKNFITPKVSAFVHFFFYSSSYPYLFSPAYTIGALLHHQTPMDWNLFQCYGGLTKSLNSVTL